MMKQKVVWSVFACLAWMVWFPLAHGAEMGDAKPVSVQVDAGADLQAVIQGEIARGEKNIVLPRGTYSLEPGEVASILLERVEGVTLDFNGSELQGKVRSNMLKLVQCSCVTIKNVVIDWPHNLPFVEGVIEAVGPDGEWEVRIAEGYADEPGVWPIQAFNPKTGLLVNPMRMGGEKITRLGPRRFRVTGGNNRKGAVGDVAVWTRPCERFSNTQSLDTQAHAVYLIGCGGCRMENVTVYSTPGSNGFREVFGEGGNAYVNCSVLPRPPESDPVKRELPRFRSGNHDAFNSRGMRKGPSLTGCKAACECADADNIHGAFQYIALVKELPNGIQVRAFVKDMYDGQLQAGNSVQVITRDGFCPDRLFHIASLAPAVPTKQEIDEMQKGIVPQISRYCNKMVEVVFEEKDPVFKQGSLFVSQEQAGNGFLLKDCWFGQNRARGFICNASYGRVENCIFEGITAQAVKSAPSYPWLEGGTARDVVFENCTFIDCPVFFGVNKEMKNTSECHRNIIFANCRFRGPRARLDVLCCKGLYLQNITFENPEGKRISTEFVTESY